MRKFESEGTLRTDSEGGQLEVDHLSEIATDIFNEDMSDWPVMVEFVRDLEVVRRQLTTDDIMIDDENRQVVLLAKQN